MSAEIIKKALMEKVRFYKNNNSEMAKKIAVILGFTLLGFGVLFMILGHAKLNHDLFIAGLVFVLFGCVVDVSSPLVEKIVHCKFQDNINDETRELLLSKNFNVSKYIYLNDQFTSSKKYDDCKKAIYIDTKTMKFCAVDYRNATAVIFDIEEMRDYEVYVNSNMAFSGKAFNIGGSLGITTLGGGLSPGLINTGISLGSTSMRGESQIICRDLTLLIKLNSIETPLIAYTIISKGSVLKSSGKYSECMLSLQEATALFELIKEENAKRNMND